MISLYKLDIKKFYTDRTDSKLKINLVDTDTANIRTGENNFKMSL